jgi:hypothetical protein
MDKITIVTAFFDIDRKSWNSEHKRDASFYINSFLNYLDYSYDMVCYIDDRYIENILEKYKKSPYKNKMFIPINMKWLLENIDAWKKLEIDKEIINSNKYKELLQNRLHFMYPNGIPETNRTNHLFPENEFSEYNIINHSKIDFIVHAINNNFINSKYTCWSDFGYFNSQHQGNSSTFPKSTLDINKFNEKKVSFILRRQINDIDTNMEYTLIFAPEVFTGTFFGGPTELMFSLQKLYHECIDELYYNFISDDDQHVYLRCCIKNPELFDLHVIESIEWPKGLTIFSISD